MEKQVLSLNQAQELLELGITIPKPTFCWVKADYHDGWGNIVHTQYDIHHYRKNFDKFPKGEVIPTLTLQEILEILPKRVDTTYYLRIHCYGNVINFGYWKGERAGWLKFSQAMNSTINSAFELLKWCKQNNYI